MDILGDTGTLYRLICTAIRRSCQITLGQIERQTGWFTSLHGKLHHSVGIFNLLSHMMNDCLRNGYIVVEVEPAFPGPFLLWLGNGPDFLLRLMYWGGLTAAQTPEETALGGA
uniref:Uncharacterized protein n=1 Tax=Cacopsylla melanoneura TaxID=428564 RepID=A0A8D9B886_9HEMI